MCGIFATFASELLLLANVKIALKSIYLAKKYLLPRTSISNTFAACIKSSSFYLLKIMMHFILTHSSHDPRIDRNAGHQNNLDGANERRCWAQ